MGPPPTIMVYEESPIGVKTAHEMQFDGLKLLCEQAAGDPMQNAPLQKAEAEALPAKIEGLPEAERGAALADSLRRFLHKGQLVLLQNLNGKLSYFNNRTGLILKDAFDAEGRYTVELNGFGDYGAVVQTWLRVPSSCIKLQLGMVPGLFGDSSFEKAAKKAGVPRPKARPKQVDAPWDGHGDVHLLPQIATQ